MTIKNKPCLSPLIIVRIQIYLYKIIGLNNLKNIDIDSMIENYLLHLISHLTRLLNDLQTIRKSITFF